MFEVKAEGLRELLQALRVVEHGLYTAMVDGLEQAGNLIRDDARTKFVDYGSGGRESRLAGYVQAADGFKTLVRPNTSTMALVSIGQTRRKSAVLARRRSNFGDLMMRKALLPAREDKYAAAVEIVDGQVGVLLAENGF